MLGTLELVEARPLTYAVAERWPHLGQRRRPWPLGPLAVSRPFRSLKARLGQPACADAQARGAGQIFRLG